MPITNDIADALRREYQRDLTMTKPDGLSHEEFIDFRDRYMVECRPVESKLRARKAFKDAVIWKSLPNTTLENLKRIGQECGLSSTDVEDTLAIELGYLLGSDESKIHRAKFENGLKSYIQAFDRTQIILKYDAPNIIQTQKDKLEAVIKTVTEIPCFLREYMAIPHQNKVTTQITLWQNDYNTYIKPYNDIITEYDRLAAEETLEYEKWKAAADVLFKKIEQSLPVYTHLKTELENKKDALILLHKEKEFTIKFKNYRNEGINTQQELNDWTIKVDKLEDNVEKYTAQITVLQKLDFAALRAFKTQQLAALTALNNFIQEFQAEPVSKKIQEVKATIQEKTTQYKELEGIAKKYNIGTTVQKTDFDKALADWQAELAKMNNNGKNILIGFAVFILLVISLLVYWLGKNDDDTTNKKTIENTSLIVKYQDSLIVLQKSVKQHKQNYKTDEYDMQINNLKYAVDNAGKDARQDSINFAEYSNIFNQLKK